MGEVNLSNINKNTARRGIMNSSSTIYSVRPTGEYSKHAIFVFGNESFCTFLPNATSYTGIDTLDIFQSKDVDIHYFRCREKFHFYQFPNESNKRGATESSQSFTGKSGFSSEIRKIMDNYNRDVSDFYFVGMGISGNFGALQQASTLHIIPGNPNDNFYSPKVCILTQNVIKIPDENTNGIGTDYKNQIQGLKSAADFNLSSITANSNTKFYFGGGSSFGSSDVSGSGEDAQTQTMGSTSIASSSEIETLANSSHIESDDELSDNLENYITDMPARTLDSDVVFQIQSNTTSGSTTFTDLSSNNHTINAYPSGSQKTKHVNQLKSYDRAKYGTTRINFFAPRNYLAIYDLKDISSISNSDFTFECWFSTYYTSHSRRDANWEYPTIFQDGYELKYDKGYGEAGKTQDETKMGFSVMTEATSLLVRVSDSDGGLVANSEYQVQDFTIAQNIWYHFAFVRSNNKLYAYIDGENRKFKGFGNAVKKKTVDGELVDNDNIDFLDCGKFFIGEHFHIGARQENKGATKCTLQDIRLTKKALYTNNFTPSIKFIS